MGQYLSPQRPPGFGGDELLSSKKRQAFLVILPSPDSKASLLGAGSNIPKGVHFRKEAPEAVSPESGF